MLGIFLHQSQPENTSLGFSTHLVHVGGVNPALMVKPFLLHEDCHGVNFLAG